MHAATYEPLLAASYCDEAVPPSLGAMSMLSHHSHAYAGERIPNGRMYTSAGPIPGHSYSDVHHTPVHHAPVHASSVRHAHSYVSHGHAIPHAHVPVHRTVHVPVHAHVTHAPAVHGLRVIGREWREPRPDPEICVVEVPEYVDRVVERIVDKPTVVVREIPVKVPIKPRAPAVRRVREVRIEEDDCNACDAPCIDYSRPSLHHNNSRPPFRASGSRTRATGRTTGGGYYTDDGSNRAARARSVPRVVRRF